MLAVVCTVILTLMCESLGNHQKTHSGNVGTVLFTNKDVGKRRWSTKELSLLLARRHFQTLLPPPASIHTINDDSIIFLINYVNSSFAHIKKEVKDAEIGSTLTAALSDAFGGYLKEWINSYAKIGFYGGVVSGNSVVKLSVMYDEIKRYLDTDGTGWRSPYKPISYLLSVVNSVSSPTIKTNTQNKKDACENLAYFEKTPTGFTVPLPIVHFHKTVSTMFVPLKNTSAIVISDLDQNNLLLKYYEVARNCIAVSGVDEAQKFEDKFQTWLQTEIVPHLIDDNVYLALKNVLSLVNKTKAFNAAFYNRWTPSICEPDGSCAKKNHFLSFSLAPSSRKIVIILFILLLEIAWCIPPFICLTWSKTKKKDHKDSNVYLFIDSGRPDTNKKTCITKKPKCKAVQYEHDLSPSKFVKDSVTQSSNKAQCHVATEASRKATTCQDIETQCTSCKFVDSAIGSQACFNVKTYSGETSSQYLLKKDKSDYDSRSPVLGHNNMDTTILSSLISQPDMTRRRDNNNMLLECDSQKMLPTVKSSVRDTRNNSSKKLSQSTMFRKPPKNNSSNIALNSISSNNQKKISTHKTNIQVKDQILYNDGQQIKPSDSETSLLQSVSPTKTSMFGMPRLTESNVILSENEISDGTSRRKSDSNLSKHMLEPYNIENNNDDTKTMTLDSYNVVDEYKEANSRPAKEPAKYKKPTRMVYRLLKPVAKETHEGPSKGKPIEVDNKKQKSNTPKYSRIPKRATNCQSTEVCKKEVNAAPTSTLTE